MTRAAIYARYSSDRQSETSIEDQVRLCRERLEAEGWNETEIYADYALSGSSMNRPGLAKLLEDASAGRFDIAMTEGIDRLSRDQEDIAGLYKRLTFADVRIETLLEGAISELHIGLKGTMSALFLKDLAARVRRGQTGAVKRGRLPGGLPYGYAVAPALNADGSLDRGRRRIVPEHAEIIRRIFDEYIRGLSPRSTAKALNSEGIAAPRGGLWRANAISGHAARGTGILHNRLYIGEIVFNRQRFVRDPATGKRIPRLNPESEWTIEPASALRIVSDEQWQAAHNRRREIVRSPVRRRPKRPLSGLLKCVCGSRMAIQSNGYYGCTKAKETGQCDRTKKVSAEKIEDRVFKGLRDQMLHPELVAEYGREYHAEMAKLRKNANRTRERLTKQRAQLQREIDRTMEALLASTGDTRSFTEKIQAAERKQDEADIELSALGVEPTVINFHPRLIEVYKRQIDSLSSSLKLDATALPEVADALRSLIQHIVVDVESEDPRGFGLTIVGDLAAMLEAGSNPDWKITLSMVAGEGFEPPTKRL